MAGCRKRDRIPLRQRNYGSCVALKWGTVLGDVSQSEEAVTLRELQELIQATFGARDARRGVEGTFMWFMEEVGELAAALRAGQDQEQLRHEFADVLAWLATLANIAGVDLDEAVERLYKSGCPKCRCCPCGCGAVKP